jgi:hypothetical protein
MTRRCLTWLLVFGHFLTAVPEAFGVEENPFPQGEYAITDVAIEYAERNGSGHSVRVTGDGLGIRKSWARPGEEASQSFTVTRDEVFELLSAAYENGFFSLKPSYDRPPSVRLREDGTVMTVVTVASHPPRSKSVTVRVGTYAKTVSWSLGPAVPNPAPAVSLGEAVDSLATRKLADN